MATAASQPSEDPLPGSLHGVRVGVCLATGITGDQIRSLLGRWGALVTTDPMTADVVVADITAAESDAWLARAGMANAPMIVVSPLRHDRELPGRAAHVIVKPVRARMLYEALCTATGRWLPAAPEAGEVAATSIERVGRIAVLLVEDDDANRRVVQLMLNELGVAADEARSGIEAIECARSREYDVILMDVQLPGCSGLDATRAIRREQRSGGAPLIYALTANVMEEDEAVCRAAGMNGYITKPLRIATLESVLTRALPQRL